MLAALVVLFVRNRLNSRSNGKSRKGKRMSGRQLRNIKRVKSSRAISWERVLGGSLWDYVSQQSWAAGAGAIGSSLASLS